MGKKKKENKHQSPETEGAKPKLPVSSYFPDLVWTDHFVEGVREVVLNGQKRSSISLASSISAYANLQGLDHSSCWNVKLSLDRFYQACSYDLTPVFAIYWLDYSIDRLGDALYLCKYKRVFSETVVRDTTKRDKEADRQGLLVKEDFLRYVKELS